MTGAITAAWKGLQLLDQNLFKAAWVPFLFAYIWAGISVLISLEGLKKNDPSSPFLGNLIGAIFIALINAIVLASAVVGANNVTNP
jgi:hypothetical protein